MLLKLRVWKDTQGQDWVEYALVAGFLAVSAGAALPSVAMSLGKIFSHFVSFNTGGSAHSR